MSRFSLPTWLTVAFLLAWGAAGFWAGDYNRNKTWLAKQAEVERKARQDYAAEVERGNAAAAASISEQKALHDNYANLEMKFNELRTRGPLVVYKANPSSASPADVPAGSPEAVGAPADAAVSLSLGAVWMWNSALTDHVYDFTVRASTAAGVITDKAVHLVQAPTSIALYTKDANNNLAPLMGTAGNGSALAATLTFPVLVDGEASLYYESTAAFTHDQLDTIFNHDINGVTNSATANPGGTNYDGAYGTTDVYRYGTLYTSTGVALKFALPTTSASTGFPPGTSVGLDPSAINPSYNGLLAIWDAYNGTGNTAGTNAAAATATDPANVPGLPPGWTNMNWWLWSATAAPATGHWLTGLHIAYVGAYPDTARYGVALQLLTPDTTPPPVAINSITGYAGAVAETLVSGGLSHDTTSLVLSGSTEIGASVNVYDGSAGTTLLGAATVASDGTWSYTVSTGLTDGSVHNFNATATDTATSPNTSAHSANFNVTIDTVAPVFTSASTATVTPTGGVEAAGVTVYDANATHNGGAADVGVVYSLSGGADVGLFQIDSTSGMVSFKNMEIYGSTHDVGADHVYNFTVHAADVAGNAPTDQAVALTMSGSSSIAVYSDAAHNVSVGNLISPHTVDGASYYYWDRSGDGSSTNTGSLNGGFDYMTHVDLNSIFKYDLNNNLNPTTNTPTTDVYRYGTLYTADGTALHVALPTADGGLANPNGIDAYQNGTAYTDTTNSGTPSPTYKGLLAIWDANNGTATTAYPATPYNGTPLGWSTASYWSATPSASGHTTITSYGYVVDGNDGSVGYVALQVL